MRFFYLVFSVLAQRAVHLVIQAHITATAPPTQPIASHPTARHPNLIQTLHQAVSTPQATLADFNKPVVLVVKKVKSILESVGERLQAELSQQGLDSKSILIIDDEADNASLNTNKPEKDPTTLFLITIIFYTTTQMDTKKD